MAGTTLRTLAVSTCAHLLLCAIGVSLASAAGDVVQRKIRHCHADLLCVEGLAYAGRAEIWVESHTAHPLVLALNIYDDAQQLDPAHLVRLSLDRPGRRSVYTAKQPSNRNWQVRWDLTYHYGHDGPPFAQHNDNALYRLPYELGQAYTVIQSYDGGFTHRDALRFSVDWAMPVGTPVLAARDRVVVGFWQDSAEGGNDPALLGRENFLWVEHDDGTVAHYLHLEKDSVLVQVGDRVTAGQRVARSGATGYATQPHLHFHVSAVAPGPDAFRTYPLRFGTAGGILIKPEVGRAYEAR